MKLQSMFDTTEDIPEKPRAYIALFLGIFMVLCELIWINSILTGNVPPERMGEYIAVVLLSLGLIVFCFLYFRWSKRRNFKPLTGKLRDQAQVSHFSFSHSTLDKYGFMNDSVRRRFLHKS